MSFWYNLTVVHFNVQKDGFSFYYYPPSTHIQCWDHNRTIIPAQTSKFCSIELGVGGERKKDGVKSSCLPNTFDDMFVVQWSGTCSPCFTLLFYAHHSRTHTNHVNQKIQGFERLQRRCLFAPTLSLRRGGFYVEATAAFQKSK